MEKVPGDPKEVEKDQGLEKEKMCWVVYEETKVTIYEVELYEP